MARSTKGRLFSILILLTSITLLSACGGDSTGLPVGDSGNGNAKAGNSSSSENTGNGAGAGDSSLRAPRTPTVSVSYGVKQLILNRDAVSGADYYRMKKYPDGHSGYSQAGGNLIANRYADTLPVHQTDWANASYLVEACNLAGCSVSNAIGALDSAQAIGYLKASNNEASDQFGSALALSGDGNTLAVAAPYEDSAATGVNNLSPGQGDNCAFDTGAVYVFVRSGAMWSQQAYVKASNTGSYDWFGVALSLSDDGCSLAVGATDEDSTATGIDNT